MWPFKHQRKETADRSSDPGRIEIPAWPARATDETYRRLSVSTYDFPVTFTIGSYSCGVGRTEEGEYPILNISVPPGSTLDFANPEEGFVGGERVAGAVMILWADDVVTVERVGRWRFLLDSTDPLEQRWFRTLDGSGSTRATAGLFAVHFGPIPQGTSMGGIFDALPVMWTTIEDRRHLNIANPGGALEGGGSGPM